MKDKSFVDFFSKCSYKPVLRNIESSLIKLKQDGSVTVWWMQEQCCDILHEVVKADHSCVKSFKFVLAFFTF